MLRTGSAQGFNDDCSAARFANEAAIVKDHVKLVMLVLALGECSYRSLTCAHVVTPACCMFRRTLEDVE